MYWYSHIIFTVYFFQSTYILRRKEEDEPSWSSGCDLGWKMSSSFKVKPAYICYLLCNHSTVLGNENSFSDRMQVERSFTPYIRNYILRPLQIAVGHQHAAPPVSKEHKSFIIIHKLLHNGSNKIITEYFILNFFFFYWNVEAGLFLFFQRNTLICIINDTVRLLYSVQLLWNQSLRVLR